ncbi:MAG: hypothetical protein LBE80_10195, partial [Deltaproteobacteria bacterium]|nr:hypothetical protein [Deltaproteobacteria bacterium]
EVYASFFTKDFPARSTDQVAALPRGAQIESEAVAELEIDFKRLSLGPWPMRQIRPWA